MASQKTTNRVRQRIDSIRSKRGLSRFERPRKISDEVIEDIRARGGKFFQTPAGYFIFDGEAHRTYPLLRDDIGLGSLLQERYELNPEEHLFKLVFATLTTEAEQRGEKLEIQRLAHFDLKTRHLYLSRFDGQMYRLDGESVQLIPNGTDNVFFFESPGWERWEYTPGLPDRKLDSLLIESVNFAETGPLSSTDQHRLFKIWLLAVFFSSLHPTKPLLLLLGEKGGGKTSALRRIMKVQFGSQADLHSLERAKPDGFVAAVTSTPVAVFDNVDERVSWLPDMLARLATGTEFIRRQLYTTNQVASFKADCWVALTARTADFTENRDDLPDRTLVLRTKRLEESIPEFELLGEVIAFRNDLLSELVETLQPIVRQLRQPSKPARVRFRMADFASFALTVARVWGVECEVAAAFEKLSEAQSELALENEPIFQALEIWITKGQNAGREVTSALLHEELSAFARVYSGISPWRYPNARSFAQRMSHIINNLREEFVVEVREDSSHQKLYRFWPKKDNPESLNRSESENQEIQVCK